MPAIRSLLLVSLAAVLACGESNPAGSDAGLGIDALTTQCADGIDNDGDGKTDYPNDPGCIVRLADDELDSCPSGAGCPQCGDGQDNDGNGKTDFPEDLGGCTSAADIVEFTDNNSACGQGMVVKPLPTTGMATGTLAGTLSNLSSSCGGGGGAPGIAYAIHLNSPKVVVASTDDPMTDFDTVLDLRAMSCTDAGAEIACADDISATVKKSKLTRSLQPGNYYLIVQSKTTNPATTNYALKVELFPGEGTPCATVADCGPELLCRVPAGQTQMVCAGPVCRDGIDDDNDQLIDYPSDPGCTSPTDDTETDVCATMPTSPACPQCGNGLDDDLDGDSDFPNDTSCLAASTLSEACPQSEAVIVATTAQTSGTTSGAVDDYRPPAGNWNGHLCSTTGTATAPDVAVQLDLPAMTSVSLKLSPVGFDSAHLLFDSSCSGMPIECYDNPTSMIVNNLGAGRYYVVVDGYSSGSGTFTLLTSGTIANGASCELPLAQSGAITCGPGYACLGSAGSRVCAPTECNDMLDNNGDMKIDFPADPGCGSPSDPTESTVCPGSSCPACSDGVDNDNDQLTDYPADPGCVTAASTNEGCPDADPVGAITTPTTMGTLVGAADDHNPSCVATNLPDKLYTLAIPTTLQSLVIDTEGSAVDTVLSLMGASCMEPSIACDDEGGDGAGDSRITRNSVGAGLYTIAVDSNSTTLDTFALHVKGTIVPGGSCESALFQAGVLVCPPSFGCNGPAGSRTCTAAQCLDGIDNNNDGTFDYPNDPGCDSSSDNSETTVCPGASCPICSDGVDNDGDGKTDYPADPRCVAASGANEGCVDTDAVTPILLQQTTGTLAGKTDDHAPACVTTAGTDVIYTLTVPSLQSLTIDTESSVVDTVLSFMTSDCAEPALECDDDDGVSVGASLITRSTVAAGTYTIAVDARSTTSGTYNLNVRGVISPGESCESPLVATGVLKCSLGFACDGPVGMRTCALAECIDGIDNNSDGRVDFPADPGCSSFSDDSETTVCPGPACPVCSDGVDNDADGMIDYPADGSCLSASSGNEACTQSEPIGAITQMVTTGTTAGATNDYAPTCGSSTAHSAPDLIYELSLPAMATLTLNLTGFDSAHSLLDATCGGTPVACSDPAVMTRTNVAAGTYYVVIDAYGSASGPWTLMTTGTVAPGGSCEGALFESGAFTCTTGHACSGTAGSRTCTLSRCNDAADNDGDGKMDFPADPGCTSIEDNDEADDCSPTVGPGCPACSNGVDDDLDTMTDYPADTRCPSASFFTESFCPMETNIGGEITTRSTSGTLANAANNFSQACQSTTGNDVSYGLRLPVPVASLQIDTIGSVATDTVVSLWNVGCSMSLGCDDDGDPASNRSLLVVTNVAAGDYAIQVDGYGTSNNTGITLNVKGTVAAGTACTSPLFAGGVLACPTGTSCTGGTCQ